MKATIRKQIHSNFASISSGDIWLEYSLEIPFVPPIGMELVDGDWEAIVKEVVWDIGIGELKIYVPSDDTLYRADLDRVEPDQILQEIVDEYLALGWHLEERH